MATGSWAIHLKDKRGRRKERCIRQSQSCYWLSWKASGRFQKTRKCNYCAYLKKKKKAEGEEGMEEG